MDEENQNEVFAQLLLKRKKLLDMRKKARELNNNVTGDNHLITIHNHGESKLSNNNSSQKNPDNISCVAGCSVSFKGDNGEGKDQDMTEVVSGLFSHYRDYDSDDSVKDKNFEPDYDTDCSHISGSSNASVKKLKIAQVKRKLFTKNRQEDCQELITLEDLLGPTENQKVAETMMTEGFSDLGNEEYQLAKLQTHKSTTALTVAMIHRHDTSASSANARKRQEDHRSRIISPPRNHITPDIDFDEILPCEDTDTPMTPIVISINVELPTNEVNVMTATIDGTVYLPLNSNQSSVISPEGKSRKRTRNMAAWQRIVAKNARAKGSPYHSSVAKKCADIEGRQIKDPCSCRFKCYEKISQENRVNIFNQFWKISHSWEQRRQFVARNVSKKIKSLMKTTGHLDTDRRKYTYTYRLMSEFESVTVCKVMFLNTLCIGEKFVTLSLEKQLDGGMTIPDLRGRHVPANKTPDIVIKLIIDHINLYPCYESHYTRQRSGRKFLGPDLSVPIMYKMYKVYMSEKEVAVELIAKAWIYRHIFNTKFNLSFKLPSADTCDDCDSFIRKLMDVTDETDREIIKKQKDEHDKLAEKRYELKRQDRAEARDSQGKKAVLMVDMQKCMATPNLTNCKSFYLRKLWTLNLTILETERNVASNMLWSENIGGRGGNEVASCLLRWAEENKSLISNMECLTIWSDNCGGQNRNTMVIMVYLWLLHKFPHIQIINHKFLLKGHTHMEVDQVHAQIERKKKASKPWRLQYQGIGPNL